MKACCTMKGTYFIRSHCTRCQAYRLILILTCDYQSDRLKKTTICQRQNYRIAFGQTITSGHL